MSTIYRATIQSVSHRVSIVNDAEVQFADRSCTYDLVPLHEGNYSLLLNGKVYTFQLLQGLDSRQGEADTADSALDYLREIILSINGREYSVRVDDERSWLLRSHLSKGTSVSATTTVHAPMPGLIVRVEVKEGEEVQAGRGLLVLEAMKMENEIRSVSRGIVRTIHVTAGKAVEKGEPLITLGDDQTAARP